MKEKTLKYVIQLYVFIFLIWGFYRYLFRLPEEIAELVLKPLIWLGPVFYLVYKEKGSLSSIGWSTKNLFKSLYLGIFFGIIFAIEGLLTHTLKYGGISFVKLAYTSLPVFLAALGVSLGTAISEETAFRGYIFNRLWLVLKNEWIANLISSFSWVLVHLPITIFVLHYTPVQIFTYLFLTFIFGVGSAFVFARTGTIVASVLLHVFWGWPIILFR
ncbi:MAG: CPBP family intramembrane glutamic endopeptidase [Patescibacteria group bacterium]